MGKTSLINCLVFTGSLMSVKTSYFQYENIDETLTLSIYPKMNLTIHGY